MGNRITDQRLADLRHDLEIARQQTAAMALSVARTEDNVAATLERLARSRPHAAARLRQRAEHAQKFADEERAWAARSGYTCADTSPPGAPLTGAGPEQPPDQAPDGGQA